MVEKCQFGNQSIQGKLGFTLHWYSEVFNNHKDCSKIYWKQQSTWSNHET